MSGFGIHDLKRKKFTHKTIKIRIWITKVIQIFLLKELEKRREKGWLTIRGRFPDDFLEDEIGIGQDDLDSGELLVQFPNQSIQLPIKLHGHIVVPFYAFTSTKEICGSLQGQTPHWRKPTKGYFPGTQTVNLLDEIPGDPH